MALISNACQEPGQVQSSRKLVFILPVVWGARGMCKTRRRQTRAWMGINQNHQHVRTILTPGWPLGRKTPLSSPSSSSPHTGAVWSMIESPNTSRIESRMLLNEVLGFLDQDNALRFVETTHAKTIASASTEEPSVKMTEFFSKRAISTPCLIFTFPDLGASQPAMSTSQYWPDLMRSAQPTSNPERSIISDQITI